jgi:hypothetical protein
LFLPNITEKILANNADIQLYRLENYLKGILMPVIPYRTTLISSFLSPTGTSSNTWKMKNIMPKKVGLFLLNKEQLRRH